MQYNIVNKNLLALRIFFYKIMKKMYGERLKYVGWIDGVDALDIFEW